jgi:hypothetical protein
MAVIINNLIISENCVREDLGEEWVLLIVVLVKNIIHAIYCSSSYEHVRLKVKLSLFLAKYHIMKIVCVCVCVCVGGSIVLHILNLGTI